MAGKTVSFNTHCDLFEPHLETLAKWVSCNGELWGVGPTAVFASAAAFFLYNELQATIFIAGDHAHVSMLEKSLISTMLLGMLALMIHLWVCSMRFFQYYLDTLIKDSPSVLLEMTTVGLLGGKPELVPLGPLTKFLRQQQPQIHITVCWFLSLCYADYIRKHYCTRFNMPYLEQWQAELHERAASGVHQTMEKVNSFVATIHHRLRGYSATLRNHETHTSSVEVSGTASRVSWADGCGQERDMEPKQTGHDSELRVRVLGQSSESTLDAIEKLRAYVELIEWAKCGDHLLSIVPTVIWAIGTTAVSQRLLGALFGRFVFRRVPLWELIFQHLLFVWMVIYSLHFWIVIVKLIKVVINYCYTDEERSMMTQEEIESRNFMQQWIVWMCGAAPLAFYIHTRPRPEPSPLMIWITTSPWQRREMGPYGYYLNRPLSSLQSSTNVSTYQQATTLRKAFSDSRVVIKEPPKKKKYSKSI